MRGKGVKQYTADRVVGITPAYAGKSTVGYEESIAYRDHPRLCGEKVDFVHFCTSAVGSPPPMRGKVDCTLRAFHDLRITPAYAGKRSQHCRQCRQRGDHPRLCGEKN